MMPYRSGQIGKAAAALIGVSALTWPMPAGAQAGDPVGSAQPDTGTPAEPPDDAADQAVTDGGEAVSVEEESSSTDILSGRTVSILLDARLILANGHESWIDGGLSKSRFDGASDGDFRFSPYPVEAALIWQPRFTDSLGANVSAAWQLDQENPVDLLEAYVTFLPARRGKVNFSAKAGLYWPEISLEHATGGAWSAVNTITPSAINAWVGEEVKLIGAEATVSLAFGGHELSATAGAFGFNDTSGTLLSFRGWALHDAKATAFGHFELPPLNAFIHEVQEDRTRSLIELDDRIGFYGRAEWRPPWPFVLNAFYYDNRGDPEALNQDLQWGWRTRFLNIGLSADLGANTRLVAQAMDGSTIMGRFRTGTGIRWVHTGFRSAFALVTHRFERFALSGRIEAFETRERGSRMDNEAESEEGWALTAAARIPLGDAITGFAEALHVRSERGTRATLGLSPVEHQTVFQLGVRIRL